MRVAVGSVIQESNTFAPVMTDLRAFQDGYLWYGEELFAGYRGARVEVSGFLSILSENATVPVPLLAAHACSGGPVVRETFDHLAGELYLRLRRSLPVDAVLLALHGGLVVENATDGEGELLAAVRDIVGPQVPIAASLDLHAHVTTKMVEHANLLVGYQTYPHTDMYETGLRTARLLMACIRGSHYPTMALAKRRMIASPVSARTTDGPLHGVAEAARTLEREGHVLAASLFPVQPWLDVPDLGFAALIVTDGNRGRAQQLADDLANAAWAARADFEAQPDLIPLDRAIRQSLDMLRRADRRGPVVIGDAGDAPSGGAAGEETSVLRALLSNRLEAGEHVVLLTLTDAEATALAASAGPGQYVTLRVGHKIAPDRGQPLTLSGRVLAVTDGRYQMMGPGATGVYVHMGQAVVLGVGALRIVLHARPAMEWDPALYRSVGLDPRIAGLIFVKSPSHFRAAYAPFASKVLIADTPGSTQCNMRALKFKHVTRPLYPIDFS